MTKEESLALYRALRLPRTIEEKMLRLIRQNRISKWFSGFGQEAIAVGVTTALDADDWILPMHRNLGVWTTRSIPLRRLFCQLMGRDGGYTNGRDRTFHFGLPEQRIIGMISHVGAMLPVATGLALAQQLKGTRSVACAFTGEGATREGDFHEALSLASLWELPALFVVENNGYGLSTPVEEAVPVENIADAASGYGMAGVAVDGNDIFAVQEAISEAAFRARVGEGPTLLEMKTFRMRGHEEASGTKYIPDHLFEEWGKLDPIHRLRDQIVEDEIASTDELDAIDEELQNEVEEISEWALTQPEVESTWKAEAEAVFAIGSPLELPEPDSEGVPEKRFIDGVTGGLWNAMEADDRVLIMGQDIAEYEGVFKVTRGFLERFGKKRVRNTPIIESGAIGAAMGLALEGFKPVVEMQYADFITCGFNQIVNNLATTHYRWGALINVTIRAPFGGGIGAGPFHSQSMEAWFCHVPGLKIVIPGTPADAKGLLRTAIEDPNPVLYFEHKYLYRGLKGPLPEADFVTPIGDARVAQPGEDLTIITWGVGVSWALEEAAQWEEKGVSVEVIDLRTLIPWDKETVSRSLQKTNRLIVLHEAALTGGFGAEIAAQIAEASFEELDAPPRRVAGADLPIAFTKQIESEIYSAKARLRAAIEETVAY